MRLIIDIPEKLANKEHWYTEKEIWTVIKAAQNGYRLNRWVEQEPTERELGQDYLLQSFVEALKVLQAENDDLKEKLKQEPCTDAISREKAKQFLYERLDRLNDDELYDIFSRIIDDMYNELPSVNPQKSGHWTYIGNSEVNGLKIVKCSECNKRTYGSGNYCPNCGAKMESEEQTE